MNRPVLCGGAAFVIVALFIALWSRDLLIFPSYQRGVLSSAPILNSSSSTPEVDKDTDDMRTTESLIFVGDIMLGRNVEVLSWRHGLSYPYSGLDLSSVASNTVVIGNFESAMAEPHRITPAYTMRFSTHPSFLPYLRAAGVTHVSLANNHSLDYGEAGYRNALRALLENHIIPFGHADKLDERSITVIEAIRDDIALVGIHAVQTLPSDSDINTIFSEAAKQSDFQIAYIHFGDEYVATHSDRQRLLAEAVIAAGADLVIGHHPHVVQDVALIDGVVVFYSLGNYIFDQYFSAEVQEGLVVVLELTPQPRIRLLPIESGTQRSQPRLMLGATRTKFLTSVAKRSAPALRQFILEGEIPLGHLVATSSKIAMIGE